MEPSAADRANERFVDRLIVEGGLWSPELIAAFRATPRHRFLDRVFVFQRRKNAWREVLTREPDAEQLGLLYSDRALITGLSPSRRGLAPVPISSSSQPSLMAQMLHDLRLAPGLRVLEIGTGTGYNAALIAHVVGPGRVTSVDVDREVLSRAWDNLRGFGERGVQVQHADGRGDFAHEAPYDRLIVTAAAVDLEPAWLEQVAVGGIIVAPLALAPGLEFIVRGTVTATRHFHGQLTRAAYFMPLRGEGETGSALDSDTLGSGARSADAPWAGWFDRRHGRPSWLQFGQSLAFFGLLHGLEVYYRNLDHGPLFGVRDIAKKTAWLWLGRQHWRFDDDAGQALGCSLWRQFLDAGGPWPTEYRLIASAAPHPPLSPAGRGEGEGDGHALLRQGPRCQQCWELLEPRERRGGT